MLAALLIALAALLCGWWLAWTTLAPMVLQSAPEWFTRPDFLPFALGWMASGFAVASVFPRSE